MPTKLWSKNLKERDHLEERRRWEDNIRWILEKQDGKVWSGYIWLRIGTSGGLLRTQ
jgi:hypothetical protein